MYHTFDQIPPMAQKIEMDKSTLRVTGKISDKILQHRKWIENGVCLEEEPFIIAVHGRNLDYHIDDNSLPDTVRAVYSLGDMTMTVSLGIEDVDIAYEHKPEIQKNSGSTVKNGYFLTPDNKHISGILFGLEWHDRFSTNPLCYSYLENVLAENPLPLDISSLAQICHATNKEGLVSLSLSPPDGRIGAGSIISD